MEIKTNTKLYIIIIIVGLIVSALLSLYALARTAFIAGGRVACHNSDGVLVEGFKCQVNTQTPAIVWGEINDTII